jgi:serine protease Do
LTLQPVTPQIAKQLELDPGTEGLVVTDVDADGAAAEAGVARGDVIMEINRQAVATVESVQSALEKSGDRPILLLVSRRGTTSFLTVRPQ